MTDATLTMTLSRYIGDNSVTDVLVLGPESDMDINKVSGLAEIPRQVSTSDLAAAPGSAMTGEHIKARPIHIEASRKITRNVMHAIGSMTELNYAGKHRLKVYMKWTRTSADATQYIDCYIEGWAMKERKNMDVSPAITLDLICPDPYFRQTEFPPEPVPATMSARKARAMAPYVMYGDVPGPFRALVTASGDVVRPRVTDSVTGAWLEVNATLHDGAVMRISTDPSERTVMIDGSYDGVPYVTPGSDVFLVPPGSGVEFSAEDGASNMSASVSYQARYISAFSVSRET